MDMLNEMRDQVGIYQIENLIIIFLVSSKYLSCTSC